MFEEYFCLFFFYMKMFILGVVDSNEHLQHILYLGQSNTLLFCYKYLFCCRFVYLVTLLMLLVYIQSNH